MLDDQMFIYVCYSRGDQRAKIHCLAGQIWCAGCLFKNPFCFIGCPENPCWINMPFQAYNLMPHLTCTKGSIYLKRMGNLKTPLKEMMIYY